MQATGYPGIWDRLAYIFGLLDKNKSNYFLILPKTIAIYIIAVVETLLFLPASTLSERDSLNVIT